MAGTTLGDNVQAEVKGDQLIIVVNLKRDLGPSKSGKTRLVASTKGNPEIPGTDGVYAGVNIYRKSNGEVSVEE